MPNLRTGFQELGIRSRASQACVHVTLAAHFIDSVISFCSCFLFSLFIFFTLDSRVLVKDSEASHHSAALRFVLSQVRSNS